MTVNLQANTRALTLGSSVTGPVSLKLIPPAGAPAPVGFPSSVTMTNGKVSFQTSLATAGYYRIEASGPGSSEAWTTVDVGVTPDTAP